MPSGASSTPIAPGQGRRRLSSRSTSAGWCRAAPTLVACTPSGVIELLERSGIRDRRRARRRHRPQRHRRQADGAAAAASPRHGHDLPFADGRPAGGRARGRHSGGGDWAAGVRDAGLRQAGRDGHRRRHHARRRTAASSSACSRPGSKRRDGVRAARARWCSATCIPTSRRSPAR